MLPLRLSNEPSYCLIHRKNSIDINRNGKIYHFTWRWLFFENTIVNITFEIVKRSIFWSDIPYEWYRLINKKSKIYHFIWQRLFDRKAIVNITFEIVKWAIGQLEFLEWCQVFDCEHGVSFQPITSSRLLTLVVIARSWLVVSVTCKLCQQSGLELTSCHYAWWAWRTTNLWKT